MLSCKKECLNHLLIFGLKRLQRVLDVYTLYFNAHRPHQGIGNHIPGQLDHVGHGKAERTRADPSGPLHLDRIQCQQFLGGLLKSYSRKAG